MILSDIEILKAVDQGSIVIDPFDRKCLGTNSYDVHLGSTLGVYKDKVLDAKKHNQIELFEIPDDGYVIEPGILYLGVTEEYTETHNSVPFLEGKSNHSLELRGFRQIIVPEQLVVHNANARVFIHFIRVQSLPQFAQRV